MKYLETGGAFCVAACLGFCSTKHLRAFSLSLHNECIKKAKPEMILPRVPADAHGPSGRGTAALNKAHGSSSAGGLELSWGLIPPRSQFAQVTPEGNTCPSSWKLPGAEATVIVIPTHQFQPSYSGAFLPALPTWARFSQHIDTCLHLLQAGPPPHFEAQCPRLDPVLTSPVCQDHLKL